MKKLDIFRQPVASACGNHGVVADTTMVLHFSSWRNDGYGNWSNSTASWKNSDGWSNSTSSWRNEGFGVWSNSTASWRNYDGWSNSTSSWRNYDGWSNSSGSGGK